MKATFLFFILLLLSGQASWAQSTMYCSHPELCRLLRHICRENGITDIKTESLVSISGDPHEFEPSVAEIKKLISVPILITGPDELNPWIKKIAHKRSATDKKTISLQMDSKDYSAYGVANAEALAHFWLYPRIYCSLKSKLEAELINLGQKLRPHPACDWKKTEEKLALILNKIKKPILFTHDALLPLILNLIQNKKQIIVAIKGSGHHEEASPASIKKMYHALNNPQVIWILETNIHVAANIVNKIRRNDIVIKLDTGNGLENDPFSVLAELSNKLAPWADK